MRHPANSFMMMAMHMCPMCMMMHVQKPNLPIF